MTPVSKCASKVFTSRMKCEYSAFTSVHKFPPLAHTLMPVDLIDAADHNNAYSAAGKGNQGINSASFAKVPNTTSFKRTGRVVLNIPH